MSGVDFAWLLVCAVRPVYEWNGVVSACLKLVLKKSECCMSGVSGCVTCFVSACLITGKLVLKKSEWMCDVLWSVSLSARSGLDQNDYLVLWSMRAERGFVLKPASSERVCWE